MDNAEHIKWLQDHAEDQARIIRSKNHTIKALRAQNSNLWCELQSRPETPSEALIERAEKAEQERDEAVERAASASPPPSHPKTSPTRWSSGLSTRSSSAQRASPPRRSGWLWSPLSPSRPAPSRWNPSWMRR